MSNTNPMKPRRGEVWEVNFDPTVRAKIQKVRPVVVINSDSIGALPIRLILPIADWKDQFSGSFWHVSIKPNDTNGLTKVSAVDALRIREVRVSRFVRKRGQLNATLMQEIIAAIVSIIEYE